MQVRGCLALVMIAACVGCTGPRADLVRDGAVALQTQSPPGLRLAGVGVYQEGEGAVVLGSVERTPCTSGIVRGKVHLEVLGPDGEVVASSEVRTSPGDVPTHYPRLCHFAARLETPPAGGTVRVSYRRG